MLEVGEVALAADGGEHPLAEARGPEPGEQSGDSSALERVAPSGGLIEERELVGV